jgi:hypothetical protein
VCDGLLSNKIRTNSIACCKHVTFVDSTTYHTETDFSALSDNPVEWVETVLYTWEAQD